MRFIPLPGGWGVELGGITGNVVYKRNGTPKVWDTQREAREWVKARVSVDAHTNV
jgi:hypothetical protein